MHYDCGSCPYPDRCLEKADIRETRYEIDVQVLVNITGYELVVVGSCPLDGRGRAGDFPSHIKATVRYCKNLQAMVVSLNTVGALCVSRTHEIPGGVFNIPLSAGTIKNMVTRCAESFLPESFLKNRKIRKDIHKYDKMWDEIERCIFAADNIKN